MSNQFKDAMLRSMMVAVCPQSIEELMMVADALRMWSANPGLRTEVLSKLDAKPMMSRAAAVLALINTTAPDELPPEDD